MARKMAFSAFAKKEEKDNNAAIEADLADSPGPIPAGVYFIIDDSKVLLLTEKTCSSIH